jgi:hypothetical protein
MYSSSYDKLYKIIEDNHLYNTVHYNKQNGIITVTEDILEENGWVLDVDSQKCSITTTVLIEPV